MAVILAGGFVNIIFAIIVFYILVVCVNIPNSENSFGKTLYFALQKTVEFLSVVFESLKMLFTGRVTINQFMGPVGISETISKTSGLQDYIYLLSLISLSLGVTNLLPIPALDGGKFVLLLIEAIRRKKLKKKTETTINLLGFAFIMTFSLYVAYNDILRIL